MKLVEITTTDDGEHWYKTIKILGLTIYYRHDETKNNEQRSIGFNALAPISGEIEDDWGREEE